jgi:hypothetical protein
MFTSLFLWLFTGLIHYYWIDDFVRYIDSMIYDGATNLDGCVCSFPIVTDAPDDEEEVTKAAWDFATKERARVCAIECPPLPTECKLKRRTGDTAAEYRERCDAVKKGLREGITKKRQAVNDGEEDANAGAGW